jgi:multidrug resistance efflux pump
MEEKMSEIYEPDNQFLERLEWQLSSEYRRASRLKPSSRKIAIPRRIVAAACMVGILMTGVAVIKAADYIQDSWRKKIEIARVETEVELKKVYLESIREMASEVKMRVANGLIREDEYTLINLAAENAELDFQRSLLNLDEVKVTGELPRNELSAPVRGGRDFVSERLEIEKKAVELELEQINIHLGRLTQLVEQNLARGDEMDRIQAETANRKMMIDKIQERLDLRTHFLNGEITAQEVEIEDRMTVAERNLHLAQSKVDSLKERLKRIESLESERMINPMEIRQMQYALDAAQAELELATLEMDVLRKLK